jgi:hypothetical protein
LSANCTAKRSGSKSSSSTTPPQFGSTSATRIAATARTARARRVVCENRLIDASSGRQHDDGAADETIRTAIDFRRKTSI